MHTISSLGCRVLLCQMTVTRIPDPCAILLYTRRALSRNGATINSLIRYQRERHVALVMYMMARLCDAWTGTTVGSYAFAFVCTPVCALMLIWGVQICEWSSEPMRHWICVWPFIKSRPPKTRGGSTMTSMWPEFDLPFFSTCDFGFSWPS